MILNTETVTKEIRDVSILVAEKTFETQDHPDQIQPDEESFNKLKALSADSILYEVTDNNKLAGWVVRVPTTKKLMISFLDGDITERELLSLSEPAEEYSALYLCAAVTVPEYRRSGVYLRLTREAISRLPLTENYEMFAWPTSEEGRMALKKLEEEIGKVISTKE